MLASSEILELFGDNRNVDPFRLAILGFAKIDDALTKALDEAFDGELPKPVREANFRVRVAVATALGLVPQVFRGPLGKLAEIRNKLAHGQINDLTESHGRELYASLRELAPDIETQVPSLKSDEQPEIHLMNLLLFVEIGLLASFDEAREARAHQEEAMQEWWERRNATTTPLTLEYINELLANEATNTPSLDEGQPKPADSADDI